MNGINGLVIPQRASWPLAPCEKTAVCDSDAIWALSQPFNSAIVAQKLRLHKRMGVAVFQ